MAAKMAAVGGIETGFRPITKNIWGREKCSAGFYPIKRQGINIGSFYTDEIDPRRLKTKMAAKMAAVGGIDTGFRHITKSIWGREKCNICFYSRKSKAINMTFLY